MSTGVSMLIGYALHAFGLEVCCVSPVSKGSSFVLAWQDGELLLKHLDPLWTTAVV